MNHLLNLVFFLASGTGIEGKVTAIPVDEVGERSRHRGEQLQDMILYGIDNRYEVRDYPVKKYRDYSKSVAAIVEKPLLVSEGLHFFRFKKQTAQEKFNLVPGVRFGHQNFLANCSAFLVAPDLLVTAGHCIVDESFCRKDIVFVFDYLLDLESISKESVYYCRDLLIHQYREKDDNDDYAVIRLDREAKDRPPLPMRRSGKVPLGTELLIIGHPLGVPLKISDQARVFESEEDASIFYANPDAFVGNSGSPVFNVETDWVEGLLIDGAEDFDWDSFFSLIPRSLPQDAPGEEVIRYIYSIPGFLELLPSQPL